MENINSGGILVKVGKLKAAGVDLENVEVHIRGSKVTSNVIATQQLQLAAPFVARLIKFIDVMEVELKDKL